MDLKPLSRDDFKKLAPEGASLNRAFLYLRMFGFTRHPDTISEKLKLKPTSKRQKGDEYFVGKIKKVADENFWEYGIKIVSDDFIGDLIKSFITEIIEPRILEIKALEDSKQVIFNITYYYHTSNNPGVFISSKHMKVLATINAELDIDIYSLHED